MPTDFRRNVLVATVGLREAEYHEAMRAFVVANVTVYWADRQLRRWHKAQRILQDYDSRMAGARWQTGGRHATD